MKAVTFVLFAATAVIGVFGQDVAQNVRITSDGLIVATQVSGGLLIQRSVTTGPVELPLPQGVVNFDDISIDDDDNLFALSTDSLTACSYTRNISIDSFDFVGCEAPGFQVSPFSGISASNGLCVISGGTRGMTILEYSPDTAVIDPTPRVLGRRLANVVGFPDVELVNGNLAAMSTDFADSSLGVPRFGTMMVNLDTVLEVRNFRVADSLGFNLVIGDTNFPISNAFYRASTTGATFMYTANGGMTVQDPFEAGTTAPINAPEEFIGGSFRAVTISVDQENDLLVVGGLENSVQTIILQYDLSGDPTNPALLTTSRASGRITSVGANGGVVAYVGTGLNAGITVVKKDDAPPFVGGCFSPDTFVQVENVGAVKMATLKLGDKVLVDNGQVFETVYSFGHYSPTKQTRYINFHFASVRLQSLEITANHMVFLTDGTVIPAGRVKVGDSILASKNNFFDTTVIAIDSVVREGAFAPFTFSGSIVVNGVVTSNYIALDEESFFGSNHWVAHLFQSPHRLVCKTLPEVCNSELYNEDGLSWWISGPLSMANWFLSQWMLFQVALLIFILPLLLTIEIAVSPTLLLCLVGSVGMYRAKCQHYKNVDRALAQVR